MKASSKSFFGRLPGGTASPACGSFLNTTLSDSGRRLSSVDFFDPEGDARDELVPAVDDAGVVIAAGEVGDLEDLFEVDGLARSPRPDSEQHRGGEDERRGLAPHQRILAFLDFDLLQHFLAGELAGEEGGQVAALDPDHDDRRVVELSGRAGPGRVAGGDRQPLVVAELQARRCS